jgi:hypothetical protein
MATVLTTTLYSTPVQTLLLCCFLCCGLPIFISRAAAGLVAIPLRMRACLGRRPFLVCFLPARQGFLKETNLELTNEIMPLSCALFRGSIEGMSAAKTRGSASPCLSGAVAFSSDSSLCHPSCHAKVNRIILLVDVFGRFALSCFVFLLL